MLTRRLAVGMGAVLALTLPLSSCSGGEEKAQQPTGTTGTATKDGTTPPGTELTLGKPAVVRFAPNAKHDSLINLNVWSMIRGKMADLSAFSLDAKTKRSAVYYVRANVANAGTADLGGQRLTLYGQVSDELVVPPVVFGSPFPGCNDKPLPKPFRQNERTTVCLVLLAPNHGRISAVQWRPADGSAPISWSGAS